jgi:hypothetical protein
MKKLVLKYLFFAVAFGFSTQGAFGQIPPNNSCETVSVLNFDGVNDYVSLPLSVGISGNVEFTVEAWVKWDGIGTSTIYAEGSTSSNNPIFSIIPLSTGGMEVTYRDLSLTGLVQSPTNGTVPADMWTHVAVVKTSNTNIKVYVNGIMTDDLNFTAINSWVVDAINLGVRERVSKDSYLSGSMDEVRIWDVARTPSEISNNMNVQLMGTELGLKAYYNFNDNTGSSILSDLVSSQSGTLQNMDPATDWTTPDSTISTTFSSITASGVDTYTAPSGAVYTTSGVYIDTIATVAGCDSIITINLTMNFTGLNENDLSEIHVYPNPASDKITLTVRESLLGESIVIVDQAGRIVLESTVSEVETLLNVGQLTKGLYYIRIGNSGYRKFVKV